MYFIGIDGGGTSTDFSLFDSKMNCLKSIQLPTCHVSHVEKERAIKILSKGIDDLIAIINDIDLPEVQIAIGLAGYGNDKQLRYKIEEICEQAFSPFKYKIYNDAQIALAGAFNNQDGIILIAGTGSIGIARKDKQYQRCGGWGEMIGDEGSGYWIGRKILQVFSQMVDGRMKKTGLVDVLLEELSIETPYQLISYVDNNLRVNRTKVAKLSKIVSHPLLKNDEAIQEILNQAAKNLADVVNTLGLLYDEPVKLSKIGGLWEIGHPLIEPFNTYLDSNIEAVRALNSPQYGAVLLLKDDK